MGNGTTCNLHLVTQRKRGKSASHAGGVCTSEQSYGHEHGPTHVPQPPSDASSPPTPSPPLPTGSPSPSSHHADARRTLVAPRNDHVCTETPFDPSTGGQGLDIHAQ
uniref:Meis homeobox 2 n=1 Tax=Nothobranchius korthausae TaxID=1143690 RepID=A0A1A8F0U6_9TELE